MRALIEKLFRERDVPPTHEEIVRLANPLVFPFQPRADGGAADWGVPGNYQGLCTVCGNTCEFARFSENLRESGFCSVCGSSNRQRQLGRALRMVYGMPANGPLAFRTDFVTYNTETTGAMHQVLSLTGRYVCSEYFGPELRPGQDVDGRRHEDLQQLTFADDSVDLVLTSDVLEHMPAPYVAHGEIYRILRPGGRHVFTVPFDPGDPLDDVRAQLVDGEICYLADKQYHGDPVRPEEGILVWTIFGIEMLVRLARIGFRVRAWNFCEPEHGIVGPYSIVFEAAKP